MCFRKFGERHEVAGVVCPGRRHHERRADTVSVLKFVDRRDNEAWVEESRLFEPPHLNRKYKTVLCRSFPNCTYGAKCLFAHGFGELRTTS